MLIPVDPNKAKAFECRQIPPVDDEDMGPTPARCAGSNCAFFRLHPQTATPEWLAKVKEHSNKTHDPSYNNRRALDAATIEGWKGGPTHGYCGLAGRLEGLLP